MKKFFKAFTLAEVLITLAILGIISALLIPSLIRKNFEKHAVSMAIKTYSDLENSYEIYKIVNHYVYQIDHNEDLKPDFILNNMNVSDHICLNNRAPGNSVNWLPQKTKSFDGTDVGYLHTSVGYQDSTTKQCFFLLKNGVTVKISNNQFGNNLTYGTFDINGKKGPNQFGKDTFAFSISDWGIKPYLAKNSADSSNFLHGECALTCPWGICSWATKYKWGGSVFENMGFSCGSYSFAEERNPLMYIIKYKKFPKI